MRLKVGNIVFINGSGCFLFKILTLSDNGRVCLVERLRDKTQSHINTDDLLPYWVQPEDRIMLGSDFGIVVDIIWDGTFETHNIGITWDNGKTSGYFDEILRSKNIIFLR